MEKYEEMVKRMGASLSIDQLLTTTDLPYNADVMAALMSSKFKVPQIEMYNGSMDSLENLETFKVHMTLHGIPGEVACRAFLLTLKGVARGWFGVLPQDEKYLAWFNKERMTTDDQDEKITVATLL